MIASCGREVKIHEWPDGGFIGGVSSINGVAFKGLSWSHPGNKLLAIPSGHSPILLQECNKTAASGDEIFWADTLRGLERGVESAIFPNTVENYLTLGLATGELLAYDINEQSVVKHYVSLPEPITSLDYTFDDTLLAAGCRDGKIFFYDSDGIVNTTLQVPFSSTLSDMMFHPHSDIYLLASSKEGILAIWDVNTAEIKFQSKEHQSEVTGICMVAHEDILISVGLDKKVLFYDIRTHTLINNLNFGTELTSVVYSKANEDVLVGTAEGRIMCFDRRKPTLLKRSFDSQKNCSVRFMAFNLPNPTEHRDVEIKSSSVITSRNSNPSVATIKFSEDFNSNTAVVSRMHGGMDTGIANEREESRLELGEGSAIPLYQVIEENSLTALKQEVIDTNKEIMRKFMDDITKQFLRIRMDVSREFCHLEQIQNQKWKEFHNKLSKLGVDEKKTTDSQVSLESESYRADSSHAYESKRSRHQKRNKNS